jgi:hypothetical protein
MIRSFQHSLDTAILLEILIDRRGWPTTVRGLPTMR